MGVTLKNFVASVCFLGLGLPCVASAATTEYDFGNLLAGSYQPSTSFASLYVSTSDNKLFSFDLKVGNLDSLFTKGAFITALTVNDDKVGKLADPTSVSIASGAWGVSSVNLKADASGPSGASVWDFAFDFPNSGRNQGSLRLTGNEEVKWTASFKEPINFLTPAFSIHVQGLANSQGSSGWYTNSSVINVSAIPEPETYTMLLAGLGLMGAAARRRKVA